MSRLRAVIAAAILLLGGPALAGDPMTGHLEASDPVTGEPGQHYDDLTFEAIAGQRLLLTVRSAAFVPRLMLFAPSPSANGDPAHDTLGGKHGDGYGITVSMPLTETGTWTLRVTQDTPEEGDYTIDLAVN